LLVGEPLGAAEQSAAAGPLRVARAAAAAAQRLGGAAADARSIIWFASFTTWKWSTTIRACGNARRTALA